MSEFSSTPTSVLPSSSMTGGGFNFDHVHRNAMIQKMVHESAVASGNSSSSYLPMAKKTGTTIAAVMFAGGVVLGADTRATSGSEVAEKNCEKIHYVAPNIYCCGAGTAADTQQVTDMVSSQLNLLRMDAVGNQQLSRVVTAQAILKRFLFRYQGHVSAALILGGCDATGPHLYQIYPHGSTANLPYVTMGSGSMAAMSVLETTWRDGMTEAEAVTAVQRSILAGIFNDLGSGSNCDICILRDAASDYSVEMRRNCIKPNEIGPLRAAVTRSARLVNIPIGATPILSESYLPHPVVRSNTATLADVTVTEMEVEG